MEKLKKIDYEAGVSTHESIRNAINDNIDKEIKNFGISEQIPYVIAKGDSVTGFSKESAKAKMEELGVKALYHIQGTCDSEGILNKDGIIPELTMTKWYYDENGDVVSESNTYGTRVAIWDMESDFSSAISQYAKMYVGSIVFFAVNVRVVPVIKLMSASTSEDNKFIGIGTFTWDSDGNGVLRLATGTKLIKKEYTVSGANNALQLKSITPKKTGYDVIRENIGDASVFAGYNTGKGIEELWQENGSSMPVFSIDGMFAKGSAPEEDGLATNEYYKTYDGENYGNFYKIMGVLFRDAKNPNINAINKYIQAVNSELYTNTADFQTNMVIPVTVIKGTDEADGKGLLKINKSSTIAYLVLMSAYSLCVLHYDITFDEDTGLIKTLSISDNYEDEYPALITKIRAEENFNDSSLKIYYRDAFSEKETQKEIITLHNELYGGARLSKIDSANIYESLELEEDDDPITIHYPYEMTREYSYIYPRLYKQVTWRGYTFKNVFVLTRVLKRNMQIFYTYYMNWYPSNEYKIPGSIYYNQSWVNPPEEGNEVTVGVRIDSLFYDSNGAIYKSGGSILSKIISPDNSAEELMRSMFLQFDETQSSIALDSDNSMGYNIADPDSEDSGITKVNVILAQTLTYNGGTRAKGTFVAQFTTSSGTKYALNWKHSSKFGLADSRYYNNTGANPFTTGTATDPTKYITDDTAFQSTEFRGIRAENTYLSRGTGAVYVRDTQSTEWYKIVIDPKKWVE